MKFFRKIFISILIITVSAFSLGSYNLINFEFKQLTSQEISDTFDENDTLFSSLNMKIDHVIKDNRLPRDSSVLSDSKLWDSIKSSPISKSKRIIPFRICNSNFQSICENSWIDIDTSLLPSVDNKKKSYEIINLNGSYYIHAASTMKIMNQIFYIENYRDITYLYNNRYKQYRNSAFLIILISIICGVVSFFVSKYLTKPINVLSKATRQFAAGDFSQRVQISSNDEIGILIEDFNKMASQLENTISDLKDAAARQETFVGNFAHELKTPLTSIIGYSDMLRSKNMSQEQIMLCSNYIFQESKRLESLSKKLMELILLNQQNFEKKKIYISIIFERVEAVMRPLIEKSGIKFSISYDDTSINADPDLLETVFINILDNAKKSISSDGIISLAGKITPDGYSIFIKDNGCGMDPGELSKITEAFYMVDKSRSRKLGGAGLGLSICSKIISLHNGSIKFESHQGSGTCVTVFLPK